MNLIDSFESGRVSLYGKPDKVIETVISKIFFFGKKVCKTYKWEKAFYNDFSDLPSRKSFISDDFLWNSIISPEIYVQLLPVKLENNEWIECPLEEAGDLCVLMNKVPDYMTLTDRAETQGLNPELIRTLCRTVITKQKETTCICAKELAPLFKRTLKEIQSEDLEDIRLWCYMSERQFPRERADRIVDALKAFLETRMHMDWEGKAHRSASFDGNGDNVLLTHDDQIVFIDVLPPKYNWRVKDELGNLGRLGADIGALMGNSSYADPIYEEYTRLSRLAVPAAIRNFYEVQGALIQTSYRYALNQPERAKKYLAFAEESVRRMV